MAKDRKGGSAVHTNGKQKEGEKSVSKEQEEQDRATEEARSKSKHGRKSRRKESDTEEEDKEEDYSGDHGRRKKRKRNDSKRSSRKRRYSDEDSHSSSSSSSSSFSSHSSDSSGSGSDSYSDSEESESEDERHRRKRKERERKRRKEKEKRRIRREKEKERKKRKKDKKKEKEEKKKKKEVKKGAVTNSWGKHGIIRETDMWNKRPEFTAWLAEVKQVNLEALSNWEEKQMFKEFMEDHNTATFPSKKYYDLDAYHKRKMEKEMKRGSGRDLESERTIFNDEEQRRRELLLAREKLKEQEVETLKRSMQSGLAQAMKEQAQLREEMAYQYKLGNFEAAAAIQKRLDPDVAM